jgi:hypothetical protein
MRLSLQDVVGAPDVPGVAYGVASPEIREPFGLLTVRRHARIEGIVGRAESDQGAERPRELLGQPFQIVVVWA